MLLELINHDRAWRIGMAQAFLAAGLIWAGQAVPGDPDPQWTRLLNLQALLIIAGFICPHRRATPFEAALPIEGRQLFLARLLSRLAMVWLPVLAAIIAMLPARNAGWPDVLGMLQCGTLFTVAYLLPLSLRVREAAAPAPWLAACWAGVAIAGALAWRFLPPEVFLTAFAFASVLIVLRTWVTVPASFQVAPLKVADSNKSRRSVQGSASLAWWPIARSAAFGRPLFLFPVGVLLGWSGEGFWPFVAVFTVLANHDARQRTRWLFALPLSFRILGLIVLVPSLALLLGGVGVGMSFSPSRQSAYPLVGGPRSQARTDFNLDVDFEFWHRAPNGQALVISSPWGETAHANTFRILGMTFYNAFSVESRNSERFLEWQFERATDAVYGRVIRLPDYEAAARAGLTPVTARPRVQILGLATDLLAVLILVYVTEWTRWHRWRPRSGLSREALPFVFLLVVMAVGGVIQWFYFFRVGTAAVHAVLLHLSGVLPDNLLVMTAAAIVPVMGMYWLVEKQFRKAELVGPIQRSSAWGGRLQAG